MFRDLIYRHIQKCHSGILRQIYHSDKINQCMHQMHHLCPKALEFRASAPCMEHDSHPSTCSKTQEDSRYILANLSGTMYQDDKTLKVNLHNANIQYAFINSRGPNPPLFLTNLSLQVPYPDKPVRQFDSRGFKCHAV